jgi:hypothetical protein
MVTVLGLAWVGPARGQEAPPPGDEEALDAEDAATDASEDAGPAASRDEEPREKGDRRQRELDYLAKLRRAMNKEMRLSDDQKRAVMELFKAHTEFVETYRPEESEEAEEAVDPKALEAEREEIRAQLREARRERDRERVMQLMQKLREGQPTDEIGQATRQFHREVAEELDPEQQRQFREIVRRLYPRREDPMRAARDRARGFRSMRFVLGEMELSDEQNQALRELFSETLREFGRSTDDPEQVARLQEEMKAGVLEILDEEQRVTFEERMKYLEEHPEAMPDRRGRRGRPTSPRGRVGGRGPAAPPQE